MNKLGMLLFALGISLLVYVIYRFTFLKNPKKKRPQKPHFTLKIESE